MTPDASSDFILWFINTALSLIYISIKNKYPMINHYRKDYLKEKNVYMYN